MFASRLPLAERYVELLASAGVERGLIGPREVPRLWERHLLNCAALATLLPHGSTVADLGSGAGLPGLVLAIRRPDLTLTLVEPMQRRTDFLDEAVQILGLDDVTVIRARAEELTGQVSAQVVTSRALAPLDRVVQWSLPVAAPDGVILAIKGRSARQEIDALAAPEPVRRSFEVLELAVDDGTGSDGEKLVPTTVVRVESAAVRDIAWHRSRGGGQRRRPRSSQSRRRR